MQCNIQDCPLYAKVEDLEGRLNTHVNNYTKVETLLLEVVIPKLNDLSKRFDELADKPRKHVEYLIGGLLGALGAGVAGLIISALIGG